MRIVILGNASDVHVTRWCAGIAGRGHEVHLASTHPITHELSGARLSFHPLWTSAKRRILPLHLLALAAIRFKRLLKNVQPDLVHAHYAGRYGTIARWAGATPCVLSVYGSEVFDVPERSFWHRRWIVRNLQHATAIGSTSHVMRERVIRDLLPDANVSLTPFGVDLEQFAPDSSAATDPEDRGQPASHDPTSQPATPSQSESTPAPSRPLRIGTLRKLESKYGIDLLLHAVALLHHKGFGRDQDHQERQTTPDIRLEITGSGPELPNLIQLSRHLDIEQITTFRPAVPHREVPDTLRRLDVFVAPSRLESFGVAVIEASALELPVVVTRVGGLPEVVDEGVTGLICPPEDPAALAASIGRLLDDPDLRTRLGRQGRQRVARQYAWPACLDQMEALYEKTLSIAGSTRPT